MTKRHFQQTGFTLIEIMVVLIIMAIVVTVAVLSIGNFTTNHQIKTTAQKLAMILPAARQQAALQPAIIGFKLNNQGYGFYRLTTDSKTNDIIWQLMTSDYIFKSAKVSPNVTIKLIVQEKVLTLPKQNNNKIKPQLLFLPSGDFTPFKIEVGSENKPFQYEIIGSTNGTIKLQRPNAQ